MGMQVSCCHFTKIQEKVIYGNVRKQIGEILRELCRYKGVFLEEGNALSDHIHMLLGIPPKYSLAMTVGYLKSKSAVRIHRDVLKLKGTFLFGRSFWARGYCVSTVGYDEQQVKKYIKEQEHIQKEQEQLEFDFNQAPLRGLPHTTSFTGGSDYRTSKILSLYVRDDNRCMTRHYFQFFVYFYSVNLSKCR